jgi:UDP-glucose 4-epimerase
LQLLQLPQGRRPHVDAPPPKTASDTEVAVLGGTGFIGGALASALERNGESVRILSRRPVLARARLDTSTSIVGSIDDPEVVGAAVSGARWIIYAVGCPPPAASGRPRPGRARADAGLSQVLKVLRNRSDVGITFLSSGGAVYGDAGSGPVPESARCRPLSQYGWSKLHSERLLLRHSELFGNPTVIARIGNAYGPGQNGANGQGVVAAFLRAARSGWPVDLIGGGRSVRDYVFIADVVEAVLGLRPQPGRPMVVNVGSGCGTPVREVLALVETVTGRRLTANLIPRRPPDVERIVLDVSKLDRLIHWAPLDLVDGIRHTWDYLRSGDESTTEVAAAIS